MQVDVPDEVPGFQKKAQSSPVSRIGGRKCKRWFVWILSKIIYLLYCAILNIYAWCLKGNIDTNRDEWVQSFIGECSGTGSASVWGFQIQMTDHLSRSSEQQPRVSDAVPTPRSLRKVEKPRHRTFGRHWKCAPSQSDAI